MLIGRVIGRVVATLKAEGLEGVRLLLVEPLDEQRNVKGPAIVACDATRTAGPGDLVHYEGGREAALALDPWFVPVDHTIMGIIDSLQVRGEERAGSGEAAGGGGPAGGAKTASDRGSAGGGRQSE